MALNPYQPPRGDEPAANRSRVGRQPASPADLPWFRRSTFFTLVVYAHIFGWATVVSLRAANPGMSDALYNGMLVVPCAAIVMLCAIALTGPVYIRGHDGHWWQTGWFDRVAATLIGLIYLCVLISMLFSMSGLWQFVARLM